MSTMRWNEASSFSMRSSAASGCRMSSSVSSSVSSSPLRVMRNELFFSRSGMISCRMVVVSFSAFKV